VGTAIYVGLYNNKPWFFVLEKNGVWGEDSGVSFWDHLNPYMINDGENTILLIDRKLFIPDVFLEELYIEYSDKKNLREKEILKRFDWYQYRRYYHI
jgi:hypothetical protein